MFDPMWILVFGLGCICGLLIGYFKQRKIKFVTQPEEQENCDLCGKPMIEIYCCENKNCKNYLPDSGEQT
jgi:hypothetical protein